MMIVLTMMVSIEDAIMDVEDSVMVCSIINDGPVDGATMRMRRLILLKLIVEVMLMVANTTQ